ncbi:SPARC-like protein 1 [Solenopsis invicta]|uniref:SPARC-like protein 1 n=1 Tax=Solenopsis invicta TaxID=13686 RepID=UPI000E33FAE7|nr:SPARC-like protein 1 [Solenopsis invicta]
MPREIASERSSEKKEGAAAVQGRSSGPKSTGLVTVASYRRRHHLAEEVPGLYIRRLTLEDPRRREPSGSRSPSPARHICHPRSGCARLTRGSSSYRSWLERIRKENPAFLTIVSLELPESPIPLIESQANARSRRDESNEVVKDKDDILDEFLKRVTEVGKDREKEGRTCRSSVSRKYRCNSKKGTGSLECTKAPATLEECTRNIIEGPSREGQTGPQDTGDDCICSEIPKDLRINIRRKEEVMCTPPCSPSPEVTHAIRIAMKYHGRSRCKVGDDESPVEEEEEEEDEENEKRAEEEAEENGRRTTKNEGSKKDLQGPSNVRKESVKHDVRCVAVGANATLDFTLNCNSVRLTTRDTSSKTASRGERLERPETRS